MATSLVPHSPSPAHLRSADEAAPIAVHLDAANALSRMIEHTRAMASIVKQAMTEGHDYGVIPGTRKPSLYQPGADKLLTAFSLYAKPRLIESAVTPEFVSRTFTVDVYHRDSGALIASCAGSCNSAEDRFYRKANGSRMPVFTDARECLNTIDKMAQKRAKVGAAINALAIADLFTQDVEDLPQSHLGGEQSTQPAHHNAAPKSDKPDAEKKVPFGKHKGKMFKDMETDDLVSMRDWCEEKDAAKFKELIESVDRFLASRDAAPPAQAETPRAAAPASDPHSAWETAKKAVEDDDDLPF
jgi:hypothetical protein